MVGQDDAMPASPLPQSLSVLLPHSLHYGTQYVCLLVSVYENNVRNGLPRTPLHHAAAPLPLIQSVSIHPNSFSDGPRVAGDGVRVSRSGQVIRYRSSSSSSMSCQKLTERGSQTNGKWSKSEEA